MATQPRVPQYVVSSAFVYLIHTDGRIQLYGRTDDVLARKDSPIRGMKP